MAAAIASVTLRGRRRRGPLDLVPSRRRPPAGASSVLVASSGISRLAAMLTGRLGPVLTRVPGPVLAGGLEFSPGLAPVAGPASRSPGGAVQIPVDRPSSIARQVCVEVTSAAGSLTASIG
jgi:hypothetical protein